MLQFRSTGCVPPRGALGRPNPFVALGSAAALAVALMGCTSGPPAAVQGPAGAASGAQLAPALTAQQAHGRLLEAFNSCNEAAYLGAHAPLFTLATSTTKQPISTRDGLQAHLRGGCASRPSPSVALVHQSMRVSGAIAVLVGQYRYKLTVGAASPGPGATAAAAAAQAEVLQNFTLVLERSGERWLVLAHHLSVAP